MHLYKSLRTSLTTIVYYILHAFQIHRNALKKRQKQFIYNTCYSFTLHCERNWEHQSMIPRMDEITMLNKIKKDKTKLDCLSADQIWQ